VTAHGARFRCPVDIMAGDGASGRAGEVLREAGLAGGAVLVVVDAACAALGLHEAARSGLQAAGFTPVVHAGGRPNPSLDDVTAAAGALTSAGAAAVVAIGGGSTLDLAKAAAVAARVGDLRRHDRHGAPIPALPPLVAVPTTAGSGSEVTPFAVVVDRARGDKLVLAAPALFPVAALLDPPLVASLPAGPLVAAGLDAVTHAIESFLGLRATPAVDALALGALERLWPALPACAVPGDDRPLAALLWGSTLAGMAVANGSAGVVHAISNLLAARYDVSHGLANAAVLAPVVRRLVAVRGERLARLAAVLGAASADAVPDALAAGVRALAPEASLGALGVPAADLPALAAAVAGDYQTRFNSARVPDTIEALAILEEAY
jgi:alcohol dehydrogenase